MRKSGKRSLVAGILALSMVLAGTGYAYWTDTLQVTAKATTGNFGVKFADLGLYAQYDNETLKGGWSIVDGIGEGYVDDNFFMRGASDYNSIARKGSIEEYDARKKGYNNVTFDAELLPENTPIGTNVGPYNGATTNGGDQIVLTINKMYPGYAQAFRSDILNVGDIAAKLSALKFDVTPADGSEDSKVLDMLGLAVYMQSEEGGHGDLNVFKLANTMTDAKSFKLGQVDFIRLSELDGKDLVDALTNATIMCTPSAERMDIFVAIAMDPDAEGVYTTGTAAKINPNNDDADSQNKGVTVTMDLLWDQFNAGKDAANGNILVNQNK